MSGICQRFVANAWRKDICSNCFQLREEHNITVKSSTTTTTTTADLNRYNSTHHNHNNHLQYLHQEVGNGVTDGKNSAPINNNNSTSNYIKNSDKMSTGRYQSPTTGIPRVNSYKYQQHNYNSNSSSSNNNNNITTTTNGSSSKKVMTHPLKGGDNTSSSTSTSSRLVHSVLNGSSSPSSTVVNVNGTTSNSTSAKHHNSSSNISSSSHIPSHFNNSRTSSTSNSSYSTTNESERNGRSSLVTNQTSSQMRNHSNTISNNNYNNINSSLKNLTSSEHVKSSTENKINTNTNTMENIVLSNYNSKSDKKVDSPDGKRRKGILKSDGKNRRRLSVKFPKEVCKVISNGGKYSQPVEESDSEDDDEDTPDSQDLVSIAELLLSNSTTIEEKEMHRQTIKNTNFNSIKTNLLGYAPIEIGPIVGCTGGKSMENSSKPLVSIGTFESRKEPLRIIKKFGGDDNDDDEDVDVKELRRKEREANLGKAATATVKTTVSNNNNNQNNNNNIRNTSSISSNNNNNNMVKNSTNDTKSEVSSKLQSQKVNPNAISTPTPTPIPTPTLTTVKTTPSTDKTVVNVNININTMKTTPTTKSAVVSQPPLTTSPSHEQQQQQQQRSLSGNDVKINGKDIVTGNSSNSNGVSTIEVNPEKSSIKITTATESVQVREKRNHSQVQVQVRPKPILKNYNYSNDKSDNVTSVNNNNSSNNNNKDSDNSSSSSSSSSPTLSNLIILNGGTIASKRTSFLKDIISSEPEPEQKQQQKQPVTLMTSRNHQQQEKHQAQAITTINSLHQDVTPSLTLETDSLEVIVQNSNSKNQTQTQNQIISSSLLPPMDPPPPKPDIKLDSKVNANVKGRFECSSFSEDNGSEFDDSLEDSGLDIGSHNSNDNNKSSNSISNCRVKSENSESDDNDAEKFGSSSDSGNENDYVPSKGLYISVDDDDVNGKNRENCSKPKLSPDSVLFSSASEMSASGSSESIPECVNVHVNVVDSGANTVKRLAPLPPSQMKMNKPSPPSQMTTSNIYANSATGNVMNDEDVYDDVASYQNDRRRQSKQEEEDAEEEDDEEEEEDDEPEEESLYDDCNAISYKNNNNNNNNNSNTTTKKTIGSYDFTNGTRTLLDTDGHDSAEQIPLRPSDGIEFIGIRKIDSETHLNAAIKANTPRSPSPENSKRSSSTSPKARRKVNQFFSTIGKKAGAAWNNHSPLGGNGNMGFNRNKSPSPTPLSPAYKRSLSQDEVSMTRTQELYATITPTSLKFKGLAPVLQKLSRMDMMDPSGGYGKDKDKDKEGGETSPKEKMFKKHKILPSLKKFLRMGSTGKDEEITGGAGGERTSYDFKTDITCKQPMSDSSSSSHCSSSSMLFGASSESSLAPLSSSSNPSSFENSSSTSTSTRNSYQNLASPPAPKTITATASSYKPPIAAKPVAPISRPPPPPPRVHSLDLLHKVGNSGNGTVKPARPPPPNLPVRSNRIAPSFVSMFAANPSPSPTHTDHPDIPQDQGPPNKPKRKASMNGHNHLMRNSTNNVANNNNMSMSSSTLMHHNTDGEMSLESNVSSLNFETLKLIASQSPKKIKRKTTSTHMMQFSASPMRWSNFYVLDMEPMAQGEGFAFYSAVWDHVEPCVLLLQDNHAEESLQFSCVEVSTTFVDNVPISLIPWKSSGYSDESSQVKLSISVLPLCTVHSVEKYVLRSASSPMQKYFALLQAIDFWGREEMSDLLVFQAGSGSKDEESSPADSELVYVVPTTNTNTKRPKRSSASYAQLSSNFEISMKQLLLQPHVLNEYDRQVLFRVISGGSQQEVEAQLKLFLQAKLFGHKIRPEDMERLRRNKSERIIYQYLEKERALCMKEAISRTLQTSNEPISPLKARFVEFLTIPDSSAKLVLELVLDLFRV